ncbi:MAG: ribonuclease HI [Anaerolineales bacterium]|nr:ribonuclease HI [Anaerolineales bacterium]
MQQTLFGSGTLGDDTPRQVQVYTDGGCDPNPGPGGWAAIIRWEQQEWVLSGNAPDTTNNRMELHAAAAALALLEGLLGPCQVELHTDSEYLRQGITTWVEGWATNGWRTTGRQPVKNQDLWRVLQRLTQVHQVAWHWLPGHTGHPLNERADQLATAARRALVGEPTPVPGVAEQPALTICVKAAALQPSQAAGWGAVVRQGSHARPLSGASKLATANAMLLHGAAEALRAVETPSRITVCSDADYLIKGASQWLYGWQARGWKTKDGKLVANRAEWEALLEAARPHQVTWLLAQGEAAPPDLEMAGRLAAAAAAGEHVDRSAV